MDDFFSGLVALGVFIVFVCGVVYLTTDPIGDAIKKKEICISTSEHGVDFNKCYDIIERSNNENSIRNSL